MQRPVQSRRLCGALALFTLGMAPLDAHAQNWFDQLFGAPRPYYRPLPRPRPVIHRERSPAPAEADTDVSQVSAPAPGPLLAIVSIASQRLTVYDQTGAIVHSRVSSGQPGHRTPTGVFSVIQKDRYHESNIYSGAPMPFMQRITWSGIALHAGYLPGYAASHGCIRMPEDVAAKLFAMTKLGMRVIVSPSDTQALPFTHPALPVPAMTSSTTPDAIPGAADSRLPPVQQVHLLASNDAASQIPAPATLINPAERALAERAAARLAAIEANRSVKARLAESQVASAEANRTVSELRAARVVLATAERQLAATQSAVRAVATVDIDPQAAQSIMDAQARVDESLQRVQTLAALEAQRSDAAFAAAEAWRLADARVEPAADRARLAEKSVAPLSIFISARTNRLYVRQGFEPVFDEPVTIKAGGRLGTHVYEAMAADPASGQVRWTVTSVPVSVPEPGEPQRAATSDATEALDRIDLTPALRQRLADRVWVGASVIVSDIGLGDETGAGTDFVVLTK